MRHWTQIAGKFADDPSDIESARLRQANGLELGGKPRETFVGGSQLPQDPLALWVAGVGRYCQHLFGSVAPVALIPDERHAIGRT